MGVPKLGDLGICFSPHWDEEIKLPDGLRELITGQVCGLIPRCVYSKRWV